MADRRLPFKIFQLDADALVLALGTQRFFAVAADIAFALENIENADTQRRSRRQDAVLLRRLAVADAGEHITQGIGHCHLVSPLPARLHNTGDQALVSQIAELDTAKPEFAIIGARAARELAPVADAGRVTVARDFRHLEARDQTLALVERRVRRNRLQLRVTAGIFLHQLLATLVLVHRTQFRHDLSSLSFLKEPAWSQRDQAASFSCASIGKGKPNSLSSSRASSSVLAVVVTITSMPRTWSMRS